MKKLITNAGYDVAARVTIRHAAKMTRKGRKQVADWLVQTANDLIKNGDQYPSLYTGRYWYKRALKP